MSFKLLSEQDRIAIKAAQYKEQLKARERDNIEVTDNTGELKYIKVFINGVDKTFYKTDFEATGSRDKKFFSLLCGECKTVLSSISVCPSKVRSCEDLTCEQCWEKRSTTVDVHMRAEHLCSDCVDKLNKYLRKEKTDA